MCVCSCVRACVCACVYVYVCVCMCVCFMKIVKALAQVLYFHSNNNYDSKLILKKKLIASIIN